MPELEDIQRQIHSEIASLQQNLESLNSIRVELEQAKKLLSDHITKIDEYIRSIQTHSTNLQKLFSQYADEIKDHTVKEINRAIASLEAVASEVIRTVNSLKEEIKILLKTNNELVQQATKLFKQIEEINLPKRFDDLYDNINQVKERIKGFEENVNDKFKWLNSEINSLHQSNAELKKQNRLLFYASIGIATVTLISLIILIWKLL
jgi:chromosome segregation ATPase